MVIKGCRAFLYAQSSPTRACSGRTEHSDYSSKIPTAAEAQADYEVVGVSIGLFQVIWQKEIATPFV
jgi:hypothetical protein